MEELNNRKLHWGKLDTKTIVAVGIGAAIFIVLFWFVKIPSPVPGTTFQAASAVCAVFATIFGPIAGFLIAFIGHVLTDALSWGNVWWSWAIANGIAGFIFGLAYRRTRVEEGIFKGKDILTFNICQIIGNALAWCIVAPVLDIIIFKEPANLVFVQGVTAAIMNIISVGILGTLLLVAYAATKTKKGSLQKK